MEIMVSEEESESSGEPNLICVLCCVAFKSEKITVTDGNEQLVNDGRGRRGGGDGDKDENQGEDNHLEAFSKFCDELIILRASSPQQLAVIKNLPRWRNINSQLIGGTVCEERMSMSVCSSCLNTIEVTMERKEKVEKLECHVRSLQEEILRVLRELEGILEEYNCKMGRIKEVVRGSDVRCLQVLQERPSKDDQQKMEELESGIFLLRECILEGSHIQSPNFTDNITLHPPKIEGVEVKIEMDDDDNLGGSGPVLDFEYFPDHLNDDDDNEEDKKNVIVQTRKSERARKPVDMFTPDNFLAPNPVEPVISQNLLDCASEYLKKKTRKGSKISNGTNNPGPSSSTSRSGSKAGKVFEKKGGKKKTNLNLYIPPPPRPGRLIRKKVRLTNGKLVKAAIACEICGFTTRKEPAFEQHLRDHETDEDKPFQCTFCLSKFTTKAYLNFHLMGHQGHYKMCCDVCLKWVPFPELVDHIKSHVPPQKDKEGPQIIFCQNCSFCCTTQETYTKHLGKHLSRMGSQEGKFKCHKCNMEYGRLGELKKHLDEEHGKLERWTCDWENCGKSYLSRATMIHHRYVAHLSERKDVECTQCGKTFKDQSVLNAHILKHHTKDSDKPFGCQICVETETKVEMRFATRGDLKRHEMKEHGAPRFKCTVCEQEFSCKSYLKRHVMALHGNKGLTCEICGKICLNGPHLRNHMICHSEERNWTCEECGKGFKRRMGLKLHKKIHRGEKDFKCGYCEKAFTRKEYWVMHERTHTGEKPYVCDLCGKAFNQKTTLTIHKKNQHKKTEDAGVATEQATGSENSFLL